MLAMLRGTLRKLLIHTVVRVPVVKSYVLEIDSRDSHTHIHAGTQATFRTRLPGSRWCAIVKTGSIEPAMRIVDSVLLQVFITLNWFLYIRQDSSSRC